MQRIRALRRSASDILRRRNSSAVRVPVQRNFSKPIFIGVGVAGATWLCRDRYAHAEGEGNDKDQYLNHDLDDSMHYERFVKFASLVYRGELFMTPKDFILCFTNGEASDQAVRTLSDTDVKRILDNTASIDKKSKSFFRVLGDHGIISYSDFLFMVSILTKSDYGFRMAFKVIDSDGSGKVDIDEFVELKKILDLSMLKESPRKTISQYKSTSVTVHLFGRNGDGKVDFETFERFTKGMNTELLEYEFLTYVDRVEFFNSKHADVKEMRISPLAFAQILLSYTRLTEQQQEDYYKTVKMRIEGHIARNVEHAKKGVSFREFKRFFKFLNNLDDFRLAVRMFSIADVAISQEEFERAVFVSSGVNLEPHVTRLVFDIFDSDGDKKLAQDEFLTIMKDRLARGFNRRAMIAESDMTWSEKWVKCFKSEANVNKAHHI